MKKMNSRFILAALICIAFLPVYGQTGKAWQTLFDGKSLAGWHRMTGSADYTIEGDAIVGITVAGSPNSFLVCDKKFDGDFVLELEARVDDSTMNSGIQFRSNYDAGANEGKGRLYGYQFELDPSARRWSGGLYDEGRRDWLYPGSLNAKAQNAFRPGVYNNIRITCSGTTIKTWLNGIAVSYFIDTLRRNEGLIGLQVHAVARAEQAGKRVWFRNIRIKQGADETPFPAGVFVVNLQHNILSDYEKKEGWKLLFDGKSSRGWTGAYKDHFPEKGWTIGGGVLTVLPSRGEEADNGGDIVTVEQFSAFDFAFEFKLTPGANSGVKYFVTLSEHNTGSAIGLEYQLLDDSLHPDAKMGRNGNRTLASLYDLVPANKVPRYIRAIGKWNQGRIIVYPDNHVEHYLNGVKVLEYERGSAAYRDLVAMSKYVVWKDFGEAARGHILLQDHGNEVHFRSLKIKVLK